MEDNDSQLNIVIVKYICFGCQRSDDEILLEATVCGIVVLDCNILCPLPLTFSSSLL